MSEISPADRGSWANLPEYTVTELSVAVKRAVEGAFGLVRVRGEISRATIPGSGHCYLRLKDETAVLDAVIWKGTLRQLAVKPEDGMEVVCSGRLSTYPGKSTYQLVIERMELAGEGALLKMIEERRKRLAAEGLFEAHRKRALPFLPEAIGVITSPTGAVIRDILHRLKDRFPRRVLIWPVAVQGEGAAEQIAAAIDGFNALGRDGAVPRPALLIVARGGGSLEDLMPFNEEIVVRAAARSAIPLISAVGHETDVTLLDFAADRRAPTPSAAAEMAVPVRAELQADLLREERRLIAALTRLIEECRTRVDGLRRALGDPRRLVEDHLQRLDDRAERLGLGFANWLARRRAVLAETAAGLIAAHQAHARALAQGIERVAELAGRLAAAARRELAERGRRLDAVRQLLESSSYERTLERGFALVHDPAGRPVTSAQAAQAAQTLALRFHDGEVGARVTGDRASRAARAAGGKQGTLL
ncbi:MAG: exodeoxyribonuclease VII large subunit [Pseudomonadota bacterium]